MKPEIVRSEKSENKVRKKAPPGISWRGSSLPVFSGYMGVFTQYIGVAHLCVYIPHDETVRLI